MPSDTDVRAALEAARNALIAHAVYMEQDYPGDAPVDCGWWCLLCKDHVDGDRKSGPAITGHKADCAIAQINAALQPSTAISEDRARVVLATPYAGSETCGSIMLGGNPMIPARDAIAAMLAFARETTPPVDAGVKDA